MNKVKDVKEEELSFDAKIDHWLENFVAPLHNELSKKNMDLKDPRLDIAIDKLGSAMTSLNARTKDLKKAGTYGQH